MSQSVFNLFGRYQGQDLIDQFNQLDELSVNEFNDKGQSLLHLSVMNRDLAVVAYLLQVGFDPDQQDHFYHSSVYLAAMRGYQSIFELLVTYSQDLNAQNQQGETILFPACQRGLLSVVTAALHHDLNVNSIDVFGRHVLIHTILYGDGGFIFQEIIRLLMKAGINLDLQDYYGKDAFDYAKETNQTAVLQLLRGDEVLWHDGFNEVRQLISEKKYGTALGKVQRKNTSLRQQFFIGYLYYMLNEYQVGETYMQNIINDDVHFVFFLAATAILQDKSSIAPFYLELGDVKTTGPFFKFQRVQLSLDLGRYLDAYTLMQQLIEEYPKRFEYLYLQSIILERLDRYDEAIDLMERVRDSMIQNPYFHQRVFNLKRLKAYQNN